MTILQYLLIQGHFHVSFKIRFFLRGSSCRSCNCLIPMFHVKSLLASLAETHILGNFIAGWSEHWNSTFIGTRISIEVITWDYIHNIQFDEILPPSILIVDIPKTHFISCWSFTPESSSLAQLLTSFYENYPKKI